MAREITEHHKLSSPSRNTRLQARLEQQQQQQQGQQQKAVEQEPADPTVGPEESPFNIRISNETYLLDKNDSFEAKLQAASSPGDISAMVIPPLPKPRARSKSRSTMNQAPLSTSLISQQPLPAEEGAGLGGNLPSVGSRLMSLASSKPSIFPPNGARTRKISASGQDRNRPSSVDRTPPPLDISDHTTTTTSSLEVAAPPRQEVTGIKSSINSSKAPTQPPSIDVKSSKDVAAKNSNVSPEIAPIVSEPAAPVPTRKIVKLRRSTAKKPPQPKNDQTSSVTTGSPALVAPAPLCPIPEDAPTREHSVHNREVVGAVPPVPIPDSTPVELPPSASQKPSSPSSLIPPAAERSNSSTLHEATAPKSSSTSPAVERIPHTTQGYALTETVVESESAPNTSTPEVDGTGNPTNNNVKVIQPPPRIAAHVPKPMRVVSVTVPVVAKPKRRHPEIDNSGTKPGEAKGSNAEEYVQKAKRLKVANEPKPKVVKKQTILRSPASIGRLTAATRAKRVSLTKRRRSGDASKGSRTPLAHRAQGVGPKPTKPLDKVTVPHAFTFRSGRRLDLKKAQAENARPQPSKVSTLTFKPAHHPAVLNRPTVASLNRALATVNHPNAPSSAHPTPKPSTLASGHKLKPTVPQSPNFATDTRMKDRLVFDEAIRKKEEEKRKLEEAEKLDEARRKDDEVRALRKALDDHLRANVHNVPEWYKERPKLTQRKEAN